MKTLKIFVLACASALALTVVLGVASASASQFRSEGYPVQFAGEQVHPWEPLSLNVSGERSFYISCENQSYRSNGASENASSELSLTPTWSECEGAGVEEIFNDNGCRLVLHSTTESAPYSGVVEIACGSKALEFTQVGTGCKTTIPSQTGLGTVEFSNLSKGQSRTIKMTFNLSHLKYTTSGTYCYKEWVGTYEKGTMKGPATLRGSNESGRYAFGVYLGNQQLEDPVSFRSETGAAQLGGDTENYLGDPVFKWQFGAYFGTNVPCEGAPVSGQVGSQSPVLEAVIEFYGCELGGAEFIQLNNGCTFQLTPANAGMALVCPGAPLEMVRGGTCVIRFGSQQWPGSVTYENTGSGSSRGVKWQVSISGMTYEERGCPGGAEGTFSNGELHATWQLVGSSSAGIQKGLWIE